MMLSLGRIASIIVIVLLAGGANGFELRLVPQQSGLLAYNAPTLLFDIYLDTEAMNGITSFSVSLRYDTRVMSYRPDLTIVEDYYPLYAPAVPANKTQPVFPATWLVPASDPPRFSTSFISPGLDGQVNVEFILNTDETDRSQATATNLRLATLAFDPPAYYGFTELAWGFGGEGNHFTLNGDDTTTTPFAPIVGDAFVGILPEPGTGSLFAAGLVVLGALRRWRGA